MTDYIKKITEELSRVRSDDGCFFTCLEHRGYPFGKPYGPYPTEAQAESAMYSHERETNHTDTTLWCSNNIQPLSMTWMNYSEEQTNFTNLSARTNCFCVADCYKGSGDSSHFRKNMDVDCGISLEEKKNKVVVELINHYVESHELDMNNPEAAIRDIRDNTEIKCYSSRS